ncbi:MAG: GDP-mannose 4,6-dehydratase [Sedimenticola sp.]
MRKALICGVSGQDGSYLAKLLLEKGYQVFGTSRDAQVSTFSNLLALGIREQVNVSSMVLTDFRSTLQTLSNIAPDEVYNLAGQTSVGLSFQQPVETFDSITVGTLNLLEVIRFLAKPMRIYNAGSSECFGDTGDNAANEETPFKPRSPYAVAKAAAHWAVANYREAYGINACTGILFNHESPMRPKRFVTRKIVSTACQIADGRKNQLHLGNISIQRDWGWAPEYVDAMWRMLQLDNPEDFVICTGETYSLEDFCITVFEELGLDWRNHVTSDAELYRPTDINIGRGNPSKAKRLLQWEAKIKMHSVVHEMVEAEMIGTDR